jgi:hypothetical protein
MATISHTRIATGNSKAFVVRWPALANGDSGEAISFSQYSDRSVQVSGIFGAGGSLRFEGSNDNGINWSVLTDPQGNDLNVTLAKIEMVTEVTWMVRPRVTAGDGTTSIDVNLLINE